jgi:phosphoglycolate phosphatase
MPPAIRAVLFDKDGTLFDFFSTWMPAYEALAHHTADGDPTLIERLLSLAGRDADGKVGPHSIMAAGTFLQLAELWAAETRRADIVALRDHYEAYCHTHGIASAKPVTDLPSLFRRLKARGLILGLATMDSHAAAEATMANFGLSELLDFIAGYDTGYGIKPGPGMVQAFCRAIDVPAAAVAIVGDTPHDLGMARAAGAGLAIGVLTGASPRENLESQADYVIESIADLEAVLDAVAASLGAPPTDAGGSDRPSRPTPAVPRA